VTLCPHPVLELAFRDAICVMRQVVEVVKQRHVRFGLFATDEAVIVGVQLREVWLNRPGFRGGCLV
jgi:hypothetical protein